LKALILAGGFGTRLRPLSCTRPKILFPITNKPLLDLTLKKLSINGVKEVILAVNYGAETLMSYCGNVRYGMKIFYSKDTAQPHSLGFSSYRPLGTGGPIKKAEKLLGRDEDFLVLNGDILTNLDYSALMQKHRESGGIATIALSRVEDPSRYGVVELKENMRIIRFVEKPSRDEAPSSLINAGIYALSPEIFDYIPETKPCSIEREVFPKLAAKNLLFGYPFQDLWIDVGKKEDYLKANVFFLKSLKKQFPENRRFNADVRIIEPVLIGENTSIGKDSAIGPSVVLGENVQIGIKVSIQNSVVFPGAVISDFAFIKGAVIGENAFIGKHVKIDENCVIGDGAVIKDHLTLTNHVTVCPFKTVSESVFEARCLM